MIRHGGRTFEYPKALDFSANLSPLGMPQSVREAALQAVSCAETYPDPDEAELTRAIALSYGLKENQVLCGNGAAELIYTFAAAIKAQTVLLPVPIFQEYEEALRTHGTTVRYYQTRPETGYLPDAEFIEAITEDIDLVVLCTPSNPTGGMLERKVFDRILKTCGRIGTYVAVDECFLDFVQDGTCLKENRNPHLMVFRSFTKLYAMAGIRLGYCLSKDEALMKKMKMLLAPWHVSAIAQAAGLAALQEVQYVHQVRDYVNKQRPYLTEALQRLGFKVYPSTANFIFFQGRKGLAQELLREDILIRDCASYEGLSAGSYRIAIRREEENRKLIEALEKLAWQR